MEIGSLPMAARRCACMRPLYRPSARIDPGSLTVVTCYVRYTLDLDELPAFEQLRNFLAEVGR